MSETPQPDEPEPLPDGPEPPPRPDIPPPDLPQPAARALTLHRVRNLRLAPRRTRAHRRTRKLEELRATLLKEHVWRRRTLFPSSGSPTPLLEQW
jgi:hypothetical protein